MKSCIYIILNLINGRFYVGSAMDYEIRFYHHKYYLSLNKHKNIILQLAWNKYGENNFDFIIVEFVKTEKLLEIEQKWIDASINSSYNICEIAGNTLNKKCSIETKIKIGNANRGKKRTLEQKQKFKERTTKPETIEKIKATKIKNGTSKSPHLLITLKGNQRRRDKIKWPHELGVKYMCSECVIKKNEYAKNWQRAKKIKIMGCEF